ncbi:Peptide chain release factor 2 [Rhynchospora pubera]|uniref:Peptide chain release factor 2 n=1 Tax=Rhynchospora pubera TaxID=906938 RepID=A0AAV8EE62_9POAL|nr:Peptide chain release factor 2 [Rhynchospora pubera]KAJ4779533.1 Peptide chain release factor 2 [Rhynchospora pubera]
MATTTRSAPFTNASLLRSQSLCSRRLRFYIRAARSMDSSKSRKDRSHKELGLDSIRRNIEEIVSRVVEVAPAALRLEEERRIEQEEMLYRSNLWDNLDISDESLSALADAAKMVESLKDIQYKAEEAHLINQLAETHVVNYNLLEQAFGSSLDASKFLDYYEMSRLFTGRYDKQGACVILKAGTEGPASQLWAKRILSMYTGCAEKHGWNKRVVEKHLSENGGVHSATLEIESEYIYGYLSGEKGTHVMIDHALDDSGSHEAKYSVRVDVIPLFLSKVTALELDETEIEILPLASENGNTSTRKSSTVKICHLPTGVTLQSSGERSHFANKMKAINRLKAKLLVLAEELEVSDMKKINRSLVENELKHVTRYYMFRPQRLVRDLKTGLHLPDLNSVLNGDIEPLIRNHVNLRQVW